MRAAGETFRDAATRGAAVQLEVTSWLGGRDLGVLPITPAWSVSDSDDEQVPGHLAVDVPSTPEWRPTSGGHPLAARGHRYRVRAGVRLPGTATVEWLPLGWFLANPVEDAGDTLRVTGVGLLQQVAESRFLMPFRTTSSTRMAVVQKLLQGILPVRFSGLTNEAQGAAVWEEDRLGALREVADAWPARVTVNDDGAVELRPAYNDLAPGAPVVTIRDGVNLVDATLAQAEGGRYNGYRVSTVPEGDAAPVSETWTLPHGDFRWGGPWGYRPGYYASPLLRPDRVKLRQVAQTMTQRAQRRMDAWDITALPDPRLQPGDVIRLVHSGRDVDHLVRIVAVTHSRTSTQIRAGRVGAS